MRATAGHYPANIYLMCVPIAVFNILPSLVEGFPRHMAFNFSPPANCNLRVSSGLSNLYGGKA